jgi:hypothetical protein
MEGPDPQTQVPQTSEIANGKIYQNEKYKFSFSYPNYLQTSKAQAPILFEAKSNADTINVEIIDQPLAGREFLASDGVVGNGIFKYSASKDTWEYVGMSGGTSDFKGDNYTVSDFRPDDEAALRNEGYFPMKYKTKNGLSAWVGKSTSIHSTQGGDNWQIAYIENPQKQFTVKLYTMQCIGYYNSCATDDGVYLQSRSNPQTIFSILDTLTFDQ